METGNYDMNDAAREAVKQLSDRTYSYLCDPGRAIEKLALSTRELTSIFGRDGATASATTQKIAAGSMLIILKEMIIDSGKKWETYRNEVFGSRYERTFQTLMRLAGNCIDKQYHYWGVEKLDAVVSRYCSLQCKFNINELLAKLDDNCDGNVEDLKIKSENYIKYRKAKKDLIGKADYLTDQQIEDAVNCNVKFDKALIEKLSGYNSLETENCIVKLVASGRRSLPGKQSVFQSSKKESLSSLLGKVIMFCDALTEGTEIDVDRDIVEAVIIRLQSMYAFRLN